MPLVSVWVSGTRTHIVITHPTQEEEPGGPEHTARHDAYVAAAKRVFPPNP